MRGQFRRALAVKYRCLNHWAAHTLLGASLVACLAIGALITASRNDTPAGIDPPASNRDQTPGHEVFSDSLRPSHEHSADIFSGGTSEASGKASIWGGVVIHDVDNTQEDFLAGEAAGPKVRGAASHTVTDGTDTVDGTVEIGPAAVVHKVWRVFHSADVTSTVYDDRTGDENVVVAYVQFDWGSSPPDDHDHCKVTWTSANTTTAEGHYVSEE